MAKLESEKPPNVSYPCMNFELLYLTNPLFQLPLRNSDEADHFFSGDEIEKKTNEIFASISQLQVTGNLDFLSRVLRRFFTKEFLRTLVYGSEK